MAAIRLFTRNSQLSLLCQQEFHLLFPTNKKSLTFNNKEDKRLFPIRDTCKRQFKLHESPLAMVKTVIFMECI